MPGPHDAIIAKAAHSALQSLGFKRKGRSRTWIQDREWWLVVVEFQPSGWDKGSYLNVAAHWLWSESGFLSFDFGSRVDGFEAYHSAEQFGTVARILAEKAAGEAQRLTGLFSSIEATANTLDAEAATAEVRSAGSWPHYHAGVAMGLAGRSSRAATLFASITDDRVTERAARMAAIVADPATLRLQVGSLIARQRQALGLNPTHTSAF